MLLMRWADKNYFRRIFGCCWRENVSRLVLLPTITYVIYCWSM